MSGHSVYVGLAYASVAVGLACMLLRLGYRLRKAKKQQLPS